MARFPLPATSIALLVFIGFALMALVGLIVGLGRWESGWTWAVILVLGVAAMAVIVGALGRGGRLSKNP